MFHENTEGANASAEKKTHHQPFLPLSTFTPTTPASATADEENPASTALEQDDVASPSEIISRTPNLQQPEARKYFGITKYQYLVLISAWLGWGFDIFDGLLFNYAAPICIPYLLGYDSATVSTPELQQEIKEKVALWTSVLSSILLWGWAIGGILFGILTDRIGRSKTMMLTIFLYSVGTAVCAFSFNIYFLVVFRFLSAMGIGGEWASSAVLVSESLPFEKRVLGGVIMYTAAPVGNFLGMVVTFSITSPFVTNVIFTKIFNSSGSLQNGIPSWLSWRIVFAIAILPALFSILIRCFIKEPDHWEQDNKNQKKEKFSLIRSIKSSRLAKLFTTSRALAITTISSLILAILPLITWYTQASLLGVVSHQLATADYYAQNPVVPPTNQTRTLEYYSLYASPAPTPGGSSGPKELVYLKDIYYLISNTAFSLGGFVGTLLVYPIAVKLGRVWTFRIFFLFSAIFNLLTYLPVSQIPSLLRLILFIGLSGVFTFGMFSIYTFYFPELFPTNLRGTGSGFSYNVGRIITAFFPLFSGILINSWKVNPMLILCITTIYPVIGLLYTTICYKTIKETKDMVSFEENDVTKKNQQETEMQQHEQEENA